MKEFIRGMMDTIILWLLFKKPMHGYEILTKIKELTGIKFSSGSIYPLLYKLEKLGLIKGYWKKVSERQRIRLYKVTKKGMIVLKNISEYLQLFFKDLATFEKLNNMLI